MYMRRHSIPWALLGALSFLPLVAQRPPPKENGAPIKGLYRYAKPDFGVKDCVFMLASFDHDGEIRRNKVTPEKIKKLQTFIDGFVEDSSYGQMKYRYIIYPKPGEDGLLLKIPEGYQGTGYKKIGATLQRQAVQELRRKKVIQTRYRHAYLLAGPLGDGMAFVGGTSAWGGLNNGKVWHEMNHNLGFNHGSDHRSPLVGGGANTLPAAHRAVKGWIREGEGFQTLSEPGTYRVYDLDHPKLHPGKPVALLVKGTEYLPKHRRDKKAAKYADVWIEYRSKGAGNPKKNKQNIHPGVRITKYSAGERMLLVTAFDSGDGKPRDALFEGEHLVDAKDGGYQTPFKRDRFKQYQNSNLRYTVLNIEKEADPPYAVVKIERVNAP